MIVKAVRENPLACFVWAAALALVAFYAFHDVYQALHLPHYAVGGGTMFGRDFVNVYSGGQLILSDRLDTIYDVDAYSAFQDSLFHGAVKGHNYSYSPVTFLYIWFFALFPYPVAWLLWTLLTGAAFLFAAKPYLERAGLPLWVAVLMPAAAANIWAGHYGFLMGALWLGAWRLLDERPRTAGVLVGLMIIKPHLAILMPIVLLRRRAWTAFASAAATVIVAIAVSALIFGIAPWQVFVGHTLGYQAAMVDDVTKFFLQMMPTVTATLFLAGLSSSAIWFCQLATAAGAIAAVWRFMPSDPMRAALAVACATFLVLPYAFIYDMTVVSLASVLVLHRDPWVRQRPALFLACGFAFLLPVTNIFLGKAHVAMGPVLLAALLAVLLGPAEATAPERRPLGKLSPA